MADPLTRGASFLDALADAHAQAASAPTTADHDSSPPGSSDRDAAIQGILARARDGDTGAAYTPEALNTLRALKSIDPAEFTRVRTTLKKAHVSVRELDRLVTSRADPDEKTATDRLVALVDERCSLFHDADGEPYATLEAGDHRECHRVSGKGFSEWLSHEFYCQYGRAPSEIALSNARLALAGRARFDGEEMEVHLRVASHEDVYWIDLCDEQWRAVRITPVGWEIVERPPVYFVRSSSMRPLPVPTPGGDFTKLWAIVNVSPDDRLIALTWMLECFRPETPYPLIEFSGTQGTAKTTTQTFIREFVDPNKVNNRSAPKKIEDLYVAARNAHVVSLENVSYLSPELQDALCQLATGGGLAARTLYTNDEESLLKAKKPAMVNGIVVSVTAQDLCDRTVHLELGEITADRLTETELATRFAQDRDAIFGGLLDLFVRALRALPSITAEALKLPRMADFSLLGEAVYRIHGRAAGDFLRDYNERRRESVCRTLDTSPVGVAAQEYIAAYPSGIECTVKRLHEALAAYRPEGDAWPKSPKAFADGLRRIIPALRMIGINAHIESKQRRDGYWCALKKIPVSADVVKNLQNDVHDVHHVHTSVERQPRSGEPGELREHGEHRLEELQVARTYAPNAEKDTEL